METSKKVNQTPKNTKKITEYVISILKTLWAIGTSAVAAGVLKYNVIQYHEKCNH